MKNGDYVIAPLGYAEYLTAGNKYQIFELVNFDGNSYFKIKNDMDDVSSCSLKHCEHLNGQDWILATESEAFLKEVEIGYKNIKTVSGEKLILGSELIDDSFNFVKFVTDTNSNTFEPTDRLNVDNPIGEFLEKNGFGLVRDNTYENKDAHVRIEGNHFVIYAYKEKGNVYSQDLNIYWLIGYLTYNGIIKKNYKI